MAEIDFHGIARRDTPEFKKEEVDEFVKAFKTYDRDGSGSIDSNELDHILKSIGKNFTKSELEAAIREVDTDKSGTVEWNEFLCVMKKLYIGKDKSAFGASVMATQKGVQKIISASGGAHTFSEEEKVSFVDYMNTNLKRVEYVQDRLPVNPDTNQLFDSVKDGVLLCALINDAVPDTIDERVINKKKGINTFQSTENLNLAINSAKGIGCTVVNIGSTDLLAGTEHIILGLIWQIVRIGLLSRITLANHPELFRLLEPGEDISDLLKLSPEQILLRWFNYHLKKANWHRTVKNFGGDIKDSENYTVLLNQLSSQCDKKALNEKDVTKRAEMVLENADKLNCRKFVRPNDIVNGNHKLNLAFVANLFNTCPGLEPLSQEELAALEEWLFASEGTREARAFCLWINSLGIEPFVNNLFTDLRDGLVILRVMDIVQPGIVDWKRVNQKVPLSKFKSIENCNYAVDLGKQMKFSLVGIGGVDIVDGNQTLTLALVWQLMRAHVIAILRTLGENVDDAKMVKWANDRVSASGAKSKMSNFKDSTLRDSRFFLDLLNTLRKCVNYDLLTDGVSDKDALQNAKYTISIARKLGATIFLLPEDIVEVKPKMILTLIGSIMSVALRENL